MRQVHYKLQLQRDNYKVGAANGKNQTEDQRLGNRGHSRENNPRSGSGAGTR